MTRQQKEGSDIHKKSHSKAFKEGLGILTEEIELALQWNRPSILIAVHNSITGRIEAQRSLEREIIKRHKQVKHINIENANPDVIRVMSETPNSENMVFFVSGFENADRVSDGKVHRALNIRRELMVERHICVVFWLNESEAANLPRLAPDFWSFRHRVVEFAPKHGTIKESLPVGLFLWDKDIPWMEENIQKDELAYYEKFLMQIPKEDNAAVTQIETILKLVRYSWLVNDLKKFSGYLEDGIILLEKYPIPHYRAWMLNAKGIELYEEGNKKDASVFFKQALNHDPENSAIIMNISITLHGLGKNSDSILTGRRAIKKGKGDFHLWRVLGYLYLSMGKNEDAIEAMAMAQEINPHNIETHFALAVCYYKNEQPAECAKELSKAEGISISKNALEYTCISILNGKKNEAIEHLKHSLQIGGVSRRQILRDPNLYFLLNSQEIMVSN